MRTENWCGHDIRFVEINGEWWAILKDICDALGLRSKDVSQRLYPDMLEHVPVEVSRNSVRPNKYKTKFHEDGSNDAVKSTFTVHMLAVNELGIYEALFASRRLEARKFRMWAGTVMQKLRKNVGLEQYEVVRMTESEIQNEIDYILDTLYWDEERGCVTQSITIRGGDVDQVPFMEED